MGEKRFTLRMDADLFEKVKISANNNKRSIAKEIEYVLELYYKRNSHNPIENLNVTDLNAKKN